MEKYIIKNPIEFRDFCSKLKPVISFDTEATSLNYLDLELSGFSICDGRQACYVPLSNEYSKSVKKDILEILNYYISQSKIIIMHAAPYDMSVLHKEGIEI